MTTTKAVRSSKGLVDLLFDSIDKLNAKQIDPEQARAVSHTAKTIVAVAALELEFRKYQHGGKDLTGKLASLAIDHEEREPSLPQ